MPTVRISQIHRNAVVDEKDYLWLLEHLNEDLMLMSVSWSRYTQDIMSFAIYTEPEGCISVFTTETNNITFEVNYNGNNR